MEGGVLALDEATVTGWAYAEPGSTPAPTRLEMAAGAVPCSHLSGSLRLGGKTTLSVKKHIALVEFVNDRIKIFKPKFIIFEAPYVGGKKLNQDTARMLMGFAVETEVEAYRAGIECFETNITETRKYFAGKSPRERKEAKAIVEARCAELGWYPEDDNAADALSVLDYGLAKLKQAGLLPQKANSTGPSNF